MTADRELLELAAKAAGIGGYVWSQEFRCMVTPAGLSEDGEFSSAQFTWNPLTDDGDALRLVVKLQLIFAVLPSCAATRRAIVRAAAETGRRMDRERATPLSNAS